MSARSERPSPPALSGPRASGRWVVIGMLLFGILFGFALSLAVRGVIANMKESSAPTEDSGSDRERREGETAPADPDDERASSSASYGRSERP